MGGPPIQVPNLSTPVVASRSGPTLDIGTILQWLQMSHENRMAEARNALSTIPEGVPYSQLPPDQQAAWRRYTGRDDIAPTEAYRPITGPEAAIDRYLGGLPEGSPLRTYLKTAYITTMATGKPTDLISPEGAAEQGRANTALARERARGVDSLTSAMEIVRTTPTGQTPNLSLAQVMAVRDAYNFTPSEVMRQQLGDQLAAVVTQQGLNLLADPNNGGFGALLAQYGTHKERGADGQERDVPNVTVGNLVGAVALGIIGSINESMSLRNIVINSERQARNLALEADLGTARAVAQAMGSQYPATFVLSVMRGDPSVINTPQGRAVQAFTNAGYNAAMAKLAMEGDPRAIAFNQVVGLARVPGLAGSQGTLTDMANLARSVIADALTSTRLGPRPNQTGADQHYWDVMRNRQLESLQGYQLGGGFLGFGGSIRTQPTGVPAPTTSPARMSADEQLQWVNNITQAIEAMRTAGGQGATPGSATPPGVRPNQ